MSLFTCSNCWSDIPAASCCAWVCVLVVCSSCSWKGHKIPSCQGAGQGGPCLLLESSALVRFAASLCRGVLVFLCVGGLLSRLLLLLHSPGASSAAAPVRSRFLPALLAASRGTQCLEAPVRPLRVGNKAAPAFSVVPMGSLSPRTRFCSRLFKITLLFLSPASVTYTFV